MKSNTLSKSMQNGVGRIPKGLALAGAMMFPCHIAMAIPTVDLGTAGDFAILAGSAITDAGVASVINTGDVGVYPGTSNGLLAGQVIEGMIRARPSDDGLLLQAQNDLTTAYVDAGNRPVPGANNFGVVDNQLGGKTLLPGVYSFGHAATANLIGTLTLDPGADLDPVWVFLASADLIVQSGSSVVLMDGATSCDVFWWVGSSATIGTNSEFVGNIMADQSIALQTGATLEGRALARIAAVTLDHNTVTASHCHGASTVPVNGSTLLLLGAGLFPLLAFKRRLVTA